MPQTVENQIEVSIASERVWDLVKDFRNLEKLTPEAIEKIEVQSTGVNSTWTIQTKTGAILEEKMTEFNEKEMFMAYSMIKSTLGLENYQASVKVVPLGSSNTRVIFKAMFDVYPEHEEVMRSMINGFQQLYLSNLN